MYNPIRRAIFEGIIGIILVSVIYLTDPDLYTVLAYVSSVISIVYMTYRMLLKEIDNEIYRVYEERLKKEIEDLIRLYCRHDE